MGRSVINITHHGDFTKTEQFFERIKNIFKVGQLDKYGEMGVNYLREATPKDTGLTSESWYYEIEHDNEGVSIIWKNSNFQNGIQIAMLLQYGHATKNGGWVEGIDYINPALNEVFAKMAAEAQKEVNGII